MKIIDSHMHCGIQNSELPIDLVRDYLDWAGIQGACLYPPVEDIYDRDDYHFEDNARWVACRQMANEYLLEIQQRAPDIHAYYFVWDDFRKGELKKGYRGIKWHRHDCEPVYHYEDPGCEAFLSEAIRLRLPIVLEESFRNTLYFIKRVAGAHPHHHPAPRGPQRRIPCALRGWRLERRNGLCRHGPGLDRGHGIFLKRYGSRKLLFGSDFPFGIPSSELSKVRHLGLKDEDFENVVNRNVLRLIRQA